MPHLLFSLIFYSLVATSSPNSASFNNQIKAWQAQFEQQARQKVPDMQTAISLWQLQEVEYYLDASQEKRVLKLLRRIADNSKAPIMIRRLATRLLAKKLDNHRRVKQAAYYWNRLGALKEWWIIGPFDNEGHTGFDSSFEPEYEINLNKNYQGKQRKVSWRRLPYQPRDGQIHLHPLFLPNTQTVAYALSVIRLKRSSSVLIHVGCDDACKIWINDKKVFEDKGMHQLRDDQHSIALRLGKGVNRILIKSAQSKGAWGFSLSITDASGNPLPQMQNISYSKELSTILARQYAPLTKKIKNIETLTQWFLKQTTKSPRSIQAWSQAAMALVHLGAYDNRENKIDQLLQQVMEITEGPGQKAPIDWKISNLVLLSDLTSDSNLARQILKKAITLDNSHPRTLQKLASIDYLHGNIIKSLNTHKQILSRYPDYLPSKLELAQLYLNLGLDAKAQLLIQDILKAYPHSPAVLVSAAKIFHELGNITKARSLFEKLSLAHSQNQMAWRSLFELAVTRGDLQEAIEWLDKLIATDPTHTSWIIERGQLLLTNNQPKKALLSFGQALDICPEDPNVKIHIGIATQALGKTSQAIEHWRQALALSPQNTELEQHIEHLQPQNEEFYKPWRVDPRMLVESKSSTSSSTDHNANAQVLHDLTVVRLHPNKMTSRFRQQVIKINSSQGAERFRKFFIKYTPERQNVHILSNQLIRPSDLDDLTTDSSIVIDDYSLSEPWYNLYYDVHAKEVVFPQVLAGDILELSYLINDFGSQPVLGDYFGDLVPFQSGQPIDKVTYVLLAPDDFEFSVYAPIEIKYQTQKVNDKTKAHIWQANNVSAIKYEGSMPGFTETHSMLHISTFKSWSDLNEWYRRKISDQIIADPQIKSLAVQLTEDIQDPIEKIRRLYRYVTDHIRYVGLEFGIHSYVPYKVSQVQHRKYGDCKDKSSLLVTLLSEIGIEAHVALVRMRKLGRTPASPASLAVFNHAICYIPAFNLWLDPTAPYHDINNIPPEDQLVQALVIKPEVNSLQTTIGSSASDNQTTLDLEIEPGQDNNSHIRLKVSASGSFAPPIRARYNNKHSTKDLIEQTIAELFPGANLISSKIENKKQPNLPIVTMAEFTAPKVTKTVNEHIELPIVGKQTRYQTFYAPFQHRNHDLMLSPPWSVIWTTKYKIPKGYQLSNIPVGDEVASAFGKVSVSISTKDDLITVQAKIQITTSRVAAKDYQAFRKFLGQVDRILNKRIRMRGVSRETS
jgi:tetratricopeptide (TPR) repeat protein